MCGSRRPGLADRKGLSYVDAIIAEAFRLGNPFGMTPPHAATKVYSFFNITFWEEQCSELVHKINHFYNFLC